MTSLRLLHPHLAGLLASACLGAGAAPVPPTVRAEIDSLMARMHASSCQFERNGSWHNALEARTHLLRKLAYIEKQRDTLASTEQFIELAATKSSFSGKPYRVKCGAAEPVPSRDWLNRELKAVRASSRKPAPQGR
jgi:hypothetical protein